MSNRTLADHPNTRGTAATKDLGSAPDNVPTNAEFGGPTPAEIGRGAIVESGSNGNGHYIRWENGEQVCFIGGGNAGRGNVDYFQFDWTYPASFSTKVYSNARRRDHFESGSSSLAGRPDQRYFSDITERHPDSNADSRFYIWVDEPLVELDTQDFVTVDCFVWGFWK